MGRSVDRRAFLAVVGGTAIAGCLGGTASDGSDDGSEAVPDPATTRDASATGAGDGTDPSGPPTAPELLPLPLDSSALSDRAVSGGPPRDGIPSIDAPAFETAGAASEMLDDDDPVFGLATAEGGRAYPQSILVHHEICNDVVGGTPVSVTYCPLTGTAMGFERGGTTFGVSGRLVNNNLIMYDRATGTWWPQVLATAIPGPWNEAPPIRSLVEFRLVWTTWGRWRSRYPETTVLSTDTGHARNYDWDPYGSYNPLGGYYEPDAPPMFAALSEDDRLPPKAVVIGARTPDGAIAFGKASLRDEGVVDGELGSAPIVAVYDRELDTGYVYANPDGRSFDHRDGRIVDDDGTAHPPDALPMQRILAFDAMWFAWSGFYPETTLHA